MIRYTQIRDFDGTNGKGIRVSLWLAGCEHNCPGCFNSEYFSPNIGEPITQEVIDKLVKMISRDYISGLSVLGGEPLLMKYAEPGELGNIISEIRKRTGKSVWLWTGYTLRELQESKDEKDLERLDILNNYVDVLIDGRFIKNRASNRLILRGSDNQIIWRKDWNTGKFVIDDELMNFRL